MPSSQKTVYFVRHAECENNIGVVKEGVGPAESPRQVEYSDLFVERVRPSVTHPLGKNDPRRNIIENEVVKNFHLPGWRHSDEENFDDLKARAMKMLRYLSEKPEKNILVVTHGMILKVMAACAVFGEGVTGMECSRFMGAFHGENTGITVFKYDPERNPDFPWWLWIWNDHAHLG
ncbi:MAG: histidine phosphatase family protein [Patescibacteria group bacterium]|nr:histidine phosphatase family protein [Patescibacteria group bacterium]